MSNPEPTDVDADKRILAAEMIDNTRNLEALAQFAASFIRAGNEVITEALRDDDGAVVAFRGLAFL